MTAGPVSSRRHEPLLQRRQRRGRARGSHSSCYWACAPRTAVPRRPLRRGRHTGTGTHSRLPVCYPRTHCFTAGTPAGTVKTDSKSDRCGKWHSRRGTRQILVCVFHYLILFPLPPTPGHFLGILAAGQPSEAEESNRTMG